MKIDQLVTHSSHYHADDVAAGAVLSTLYPNAKFVRSRDSIDTSPQSNRIIWDIGHIYDSNNQTFDHHQSDGAGHRSNGVPLASFGLIWQHYGHAYLKKIGVPLKLIEDTWAIVDEQFVQPMDAHDAGYLKNKDHADFVRAVSQSVPSQQWFKQSGKWSISPYILSAEFDQKYLEMVRIAQALLKNYVFNTIQNRHDIHIDNMRVMAYNMLACAIKKAANPSIAAGHYFDPKIIKNGLFGRVLWKPVNIEQIWKTNQNVIFKKLSVSPQFYNKIERKVLNLLLSDTTLSSQKQTSLISVIEHALTSHVHKSDKDILLAVENVVDYAMRMIIDYIVSAFRALTGHAMIQEQLNSWDDPYGGGVLILPGSAEYTSIVNKYNQTKSEKKIYTVIYPFMQEGEIRWNVKHMTKSFDTYETFVKFPQAACGKTGEDIAIGLGLPQFADKYIFCHNNGHYLVARDKDSALAAAKVSV